MDKIKALSIVILFSLLSLTCFPQESNNNLAKRDSLKRNIFDFTLAGTGLVVSFNYCRIIQVKPDYFMSATIGLGSVPFAGGITIPHQLTYNFGRKNNFLEAGIGGVYWQGYENQENGKEQLYSYNIVPIVGYRKNFSNNKMVFRIYISPIIRVSGEYFYKTHPALPYGGISFGYSF
jgi:hypothetical protein